MKKLVLAIIGAFAAGAMAGPAQATLINVAGPLSSFGFAPSIIGAPAHALDDITTNSGMQGFDEAQGVLTSVAHGIDGGGFIAAGTLVDSHMIFLNSVGTAALSHFSVDWSFSGMILGIMSNSGGTLEAASTFELGAPGTNYTVTFAGSGLAAPFAARGIENNNGGGGPFPACFEALAALRRSNGPTGPCGRLWPACQTLPRCPNGADGARRL